MAEEPPGQGEPALPRTERPDAPLYLASYLRRRARAAAPEPGGEPAPADTETDAATPLYLRRFRERRADPTPPTPPRRSGTASRSR